jgi:hypothetical protein
VYRRITVAEVQVRRGGFVGIAEMLGHLELAGARIIECPAILESRLIGHSKMRVIRTAVGHLLLMAQLAKLRLTGRRIAGAPAIGSRATDGQS